MTTFTTKWTMPQESVNDLTAAGQWSSWVLQVDGSKNHVTWFEGKPFQEINANIVVDYGVYAIPATTLTDGAVLNLEAMVHQPANLGSSYIWDGTAFVKDPVGCDRSSVKVTNMATTAWIIGLTETDKPICADTVPPPAPVPPTPTPPADAGSNAKPAVAADLNAVVYTPTLIIYVTTGAKYEAVSVVTDVTSWTGPFNITTLNTSFLYDQTSKVWTQVN